MIELSVLLNGIVLFLVIRGLYNLLQRIITLESKVHQLDELYDKNRESIYQCLKSLHKLADIVQNKKDK